MNGRRIERCLLFLFRGAKILYVFVLHVVEQGHIYKISVLYNIIDKYSAH